MIDIGDLSRFALVKPGQGFTLEGDRRHVTLEVNCEADTVFHVQYGDGDVRFLALVSGRDSVRFVADGRATVIPTSEGEVWVWCSEFDTMAVVVPDAETFTTIANRRARNPELEKMMAKMSANIDRRMSHLMAEYEGMAAAAQARADAAEAELKAREAKRGGKRKASAPAAAGGESEPQGAADVAAPSGGAGDSGGDPGGAGE